MRKFLRKAQLPTQPELRPLSTSAPFSRGCLHPPHLLWGLWNEARVGREPGGGQVLSRGGDEGLQARRVSIPRKQGTFSLQAPQSQRGLCVSWLWVGGLACRLPCWSTLSQSLLVPAVSSPWQSIPCPGQGFVAPPPPGELLHPRNPPWGSALQGAAATSHPGPSPDGQRAEVGACSPDPVPALALA